MHVFIHNYKIIEHYFKHCLHLFTQFYCLRKKSDIFLQKSYHMLEMCNNMSNVYIELNNRDIYKPLLPERPLMAILLRLFIGTVTMFAQRM